MTATNVRVQMQQRRDTAANWTSADPTLLAGELGYESDTGKLKIGDGSTAWSSLAYQSGFSLSAYPLATSDIADDAITGDKLANDITIANDLTVTGDLTVNGTTLTIDTTNLVVEDKNIEMGAVATPTDLTADGGGITLKGTTDHTILWTDSTDSWDFSEHVNIASGKEFRINGTKVLDATGLGSSVVSSSLTSVGTIATGVWNGTAIATAYIADDAVTADKLADTAVTAGSYTAADITVDAQGRITAASSGTAPDSDKIEEGNTSVEVIDTGSDGRVVFTTEGSEAARIDSSGHVIIGATTANSFNGVGGSNNLIVAGSTSDTDITDNSSAAITISNTDGTANNTAGLHFAREDTDGTPHYNGASVVAQFKETQVTGEYPKADLAFLTSTAANNAPSEKMRLLADGKAGIGTSVPDSLLEVEGTAASGGIISRCTDTQSTSSNKGLRVRNNSDTDTFYVGFNGQSRIYAENDGLEIYGDIGTANTGGTKGHLLIKRGTNDVLVGSITSTTTSTAFNTSSDYRLKENVVEISDGITRVKQLQPKRFNFIANAGTTVDGFLAHEAQAVVPEAVTGTHNEVDDDGNAVMQGIDQSKLVPLLTAALQEAIAKIETLETKVAALEAA